MVVSSAAAKHHSAVQLYFGVASTKQALSATLQLLLLSLTPGLKVFLIIFATALSTTISSFYSSGFCMIHFFPIVIRKEQQSEKIWKYFKEPHALFLGSSFFFSCLPTVMKSAPCHEWDLENASCLCVAAALIHSIAKWRLWLFEVISKVSPPVFFWSFLFQSMQLSLHFTSLTCVSCVACAKW